MSTPARSKKSKGKIEDIEDKMKMFKNSHLYSITINPCDNLQYRKHKDRLMAVRRHLINDLTELKDYLEYIVLWIDVSPCYKVGAGKYPRVHFHGTIKFKDVVSFHLNVHTLDQHYNVDIDTIDDPKYWEAYCKKFHKYAPVLVPYNPKITLKDIVECKKEQKDDTTERTIFDYLPQ